MTTDPLDQQIQVLIDDAAKNNVAPDVIRAIAPVLKAFAQRLSHSEYFVVQNLNQQWVITILNRKQPDQSNVEKRMIYAYSALDDVKKGPTPMQMNDPNLMAIPMPITHILFQLFSMKQIESVIFLDTPGQPSRGVEVRRQDVDLAIKMQLQQTQGVGTVPPDIA